MLALPPRLGDLDALIKRKTTAVKRREDFRSLMEDCYDYVLPQRSNFGSETPGEKRGRDIYDLTPGQAVADFASRMQATICPPWRQWSKLAPGPGLPKEVQEDDRISALLEEQTETFFGYINHSNFATASHEAFQDVAIGTGAITMELDESAKGLTFESIPPMMLAIEQGPRGQIETTFVDRKCAVSHIRRLYPQADLPTEWTAMLADPAKADTEVSYVQAHVYEPIGEVVYLVVYVEKPKHILYLRAVGRTSPVIVFRWSVNSGEVWGRGPVMTALPTIKTLNKAVEDELVAAAMSLAPPMTGVSDGVLNPYTVQIMPNTIIPVMSNDQANPTLKPLLQDPNVQFGQIVIQDLRQMVRQALFTDPRRREGPVQSATEVMIEDREFVQRIGAAFGRLQSEFLAKVIARGVDLLSQINKMAPIRVDGREVTLKYTSPLARQQDQEELMSIRTALELTSGFGPEAVQAAFKTESIGEEIGVMAGVNRKLLRSDEDRAKIAQQMQQLMAQQAQAQQGAPAAA